jgi:putative ABC transport system substrate-binding protein
MRRRDFITLVGGTAAWPFGVRAQQHMPVIGFLAVGTEADSIIAGPLRQGLRESGYVEGHNVRIEYRYTDGRNERLPELAAELVRLPATVIFAGTGGVTARAAKAATSTIPIVFANGENPVKTGLVASLNRPGGNITGVTFFTIELGPKRIDIIRELAPGARAIGILANPKSTNVESEASVASVQSAILSGGQDVVVVHAASPNDVVVAFDRLVAEKVGAVQLISDPMFTTQRNQIAALAARHRIPAIYPLREFAAAGGLVSYGASGPEAWRKAGNYVAQILKGAKPADLPVLQPTRFELVINIQVAKAMGLAVPATLLARADEVIE